MSAAGEAARIAVCISGGGRTLLNLVDRIEAGELRARIGLVVASRECPGAQRARRLGLPVRVEEGDIAPERLAAMLEEAGCAWIVLAGYLRLAPIPPGFEGRMVNIHPALLPSFAGRGMHGMRVHEAVLEAGCKVSGCTAHLCDAQYDTGPILLQRCCEVRDDDTPETLAARVFELEKEVLPEALSLLLSGAIEVEGRRTRRRSPAER